MEEKKLMVSCKLAYWMNSYKNWHSWLYLKFPVELHTLHRRLFHCDSTNSLSYFFLFFFSVHIFKSKSSYLRHKERNLKSKAGLSNQKKVLRRRRKREHTRQQEASLSLFLYNIFWVNKWIVWNTRVCVERSDITEEKYGKVKNVIWKHTCYGSVAVWNTIFRCTLHTSKEKEEKKQPIWKCKQA